GSLLEILEPSVIDIFETTEYAPFTYESADDFWTIVTNFTPPVGCTSDIPSVSTTVDNDIKAAVFTLTCDLTVVASTSVPTQVAAVGSFGKLKKGIAQADFQIQDCSSGKCKEHNRKSEIKAEFKVKKVKAPKKIKKVKAGPASLWDAVRSLLGVDASSASIGTAVRNIAEQNSISIPEFGIRGLFDSRRLSPSFLEGLDYSNVE
ncbi:hypothetical protein COB64_04225, partial [Candidatus Wolfebacteria bacterium]